ncbi:Endoribonuclease L-PSP family protein [Aspergillus niger]|uniref:Endoribonuclease L-PSP family protein n=1 Tax=Aspergillus niger TaxID=5061 RepID=A0A505HYK0_ASPNG|nr:Endoribonuclease L-PSP family protein [Aspergillus niger]
MTTTLWDPDRILQITKGPHERGMFCLGRARSRYDSRCRWDIPYTKYQIVRETLDEIAAKLPHEIYDDELKVLAKWGLCDYHSGQVHEVVSGWHYALASLANLYSAYKERAETSHTVHQILQAEVKRCRDLLPPDEDNPQKNLSVLLKRHMRKYSELAKLETSEKKCQALREENAGLVVEVRAKGEECERLQEQLGEATAEFSDMQRANEKLRDVNEEMRKEVDDKQGQLNEITAELSVVRCNNSNLRDANEEMRRKIERKQERLNEIRGDLFDMGFAKDSLEDANEKMRREVDSKQEQIETITAQLASVSADLDSTKNELSVACETKTQVQNDLREAVEEISNLQAQLTEIHEQQSTTIWCKIKRWIREKASCLSRYRRRYGMRDKEEEVALAPVKPINVG